MAQSQVTAIVNTFDQIDFVNGTSFSSPTIVGAVTCLWQALPTLNNFQIIQLVRESASPFQNPTDETGYGIPDFAMALNNGRSIVAENKSIQEGFVVYGNPVDNWVNILLPKQILEGKVWFYSILGQEVLQTNITPTQNRIDVSKLISGIYITVASGGKESIHLK